MENPDYYLRVLLVFVCIGIGLRVVAILIFNDYTNPLTAEYGVVARNLAAGKGFVGGGWLGPEAPTALNTPIYPFFLAGWLYSGLPMPYLWVELFQALLSSLIIYFTAEIARVWSTRSVGIITAFGLTFYPPLIYFCKQVSPAIFSVFFTILSIYIITRLSIEPTLKKGMLAGIVFGLAILTEPILLVGIPGMGMLILLRRLEISSNKLLRVFLVAGGVSCFVLMPWVVRNYLVFKRFVPLKTSMGLNLWMGNNPYATGYLYTSSGAPMQNKLQSEMLAMLAEVDEATRYKILQSMAFEWIRSHPGEFLMLTFKRIGYLWWISPTYRVTTANINEPRRFYLLRSLIQGVTLLLGGLGSIVAMRRNQQLVVFICWWIFIFTAPYAISVAGNTRYRLPVEPLLVIFIGFLGVKFMEKIAYEINDL